MPGRSSARSAFAGRTTGRAGIALAVLPAPALASRFATATFEGSEYFLLLFLLLGYALLTHLLMLAAQFRRTWLTLVHLLIGVVSPFLLHAAWSTSRAAYMLSDMLWLLWASAGVLLVPLLLVPPLLQWWLPRRQSAAHAETRLGAGGGPVPDRRRPARLGRNALSRASAPAQHCECTSVNRPRPAPLWARSFRGDMACPP